MSSLKADTCSFRSLDEMMVVLEVALLAPLESESKNECMMLGAKRVAKLRVSILLPGTTVPMNTCELRIMSTDCYLPFQNIKTYHVSPFCPLRCRQRGQETASRRKACRD